MKREKGGGAVLLAYSSLCESRRSGDVRSVLERCCVFEESKGDEREVPLTGQRPGIEIEQGDDELDDA